MKTLLLGLSLLFPALLAAATMDKDIAHVVITQSELENASRWDELRRWINEATTRGAKSLILEINVTQGSAQESLPIAEEIAKLKVRTLAYVNTSAVAGGALMALACNEIWMAPGSRIGAAPPAVPESEDLSPKAQDTKLAESLAVLKAGARSLAKLKGHKPEIAEAFVDRDKGLEPHAAKGELLLLDADNAVPLLAKGIAADLKGIAKDAKVVTLTSAWFDQKPAEAPKDVAEAKTEKKASSGIYTGKVVVITVGEEDLIIPARFEFMKRTLRLCDEQGAEAVLFDLDTPGGMAWETTTLMMQDLQKLTIRSLSYVNTRAISAGALTAMATDTIYMAPASSIGAATPVTGGGESMGEAERAKYNSAFLGMARAAVRAKGHDVRILEGMIDMNAGLVINGKVIVPKGQIVTLDADQATMLVAGKPLLAKAIVKSIDDIKGRELLKGETLIAEPTMFEWIAIWVTQFAWLLILVGIASGYLEMQTPGFGLAGFVALIAFSIFFFGHYVAGSLVGHETMIMTLLFVVGVVLIGVELLAAPGTIIPGLLGFLCIMVALVYTMSGWEIAPVMPTEGSTTPVESGGTFNLAQYAVGLRNFALGVTGAGILIALMIAWVPELRPFRALVLEAAAGGTAADAPAQRDAAKARIGDTGITRSALRPYGSIEIGGKIIEAVADANAYLESGRAVRVREISADKIIVEAV
jgi:membrane-bound serine protease (ClpP class)